jgi:hypothetical protein
VPQGSKDLREIRNGGEGSGDVSDDGGDSHN